MAVWTRLTASIGVLTLVATACAPFGGGDSSDASELPPAPRVDAMRNPEPIAHVDGLHHVIVSVPDGLFDPTGQVVEGVLDSTAEGGAGDGGPLTLTRELLAELPPGGTLVVRDGVLGYLDADGSFVALTVEQQGAAATAEPTIDVDPTPVADALAALPGVRSVDTITASTFAVQATSLTAIEELGVTIAEDATFALTADPYEPYQWALDNDGLSLSGVESTVTQVPDADVDGMEARTGATGAGVIVAVIDSGVDFGHPDLAGAAWVNPGEDCDGTPNGVDDDGNGLVDDCAGWDFGDGDAQTHDGTNDDHGTHVAGIIAAGADNGTGIAGIAPDSQIMDLKVNDRAGVIASSAIARAIRYATDHGAQVINLSLGSTPGASFESVAPVADAIDHAGASGVLVVAAAGNNSVSLDDLAVYPASFDAANMLVVGASTPSDTRASFSNTGSAVDLFAPGELILSTIGGGELAFQSGSSQAAPMVAATAALVLEAEGAIGPAGLIDRVVGSADAVDALVGLASTPGRLNTARALGIEPGDSVTISGLSADENGHVSAVVSLPDLGGQFNQLFHWEASLVVLVDGAPFAVTGHPVTVADDDGRAEGAGSTDVRGNVRLADGPGRVTWSTTLPPGEYALLIEAIPRTDPTVRLGDAFLARFDVAGEGDGAPTSDGDTGDDSAGGSDVDPTDPTGTDGSGSGEAPDQSTDDSGESGSDPGDGSDADPSDDGDTDDPSTEDDITDDDQGDEEDPADEEDDADEDDDETADDPDESDDTEDDEEDEQDEDDESDAGDDEAGEEDDSDETAEDGDTDTGTDDQADETTDDEDVIDLGPDEGADGEWSITSVSPRTGPVDTENLVKLTGTFPDPSVVVWFGDSPVDVTYSSDELLTVRTRRHAEPETVDVILRSGGAEVLVLPDAFAFVPIGDDPVVVEPDDDDPSDPGFGIGPDDGIVIDEPPPGDDDRGKGHDKSKSRNRQSRAEVLGPPRLLPNGLTGVPLSGLDTIGGVPSCDEDLCRTRRI